jgi:hypothetical protein
MVSLLLSEQLVLQPLGFSVQVRDALLVLLYVSNVVALAISV